jgi:FixJ family two-component response regulator
MAVQALKAGSIDYIVKSDTTLTHMPDFAKQAIHEWAARLAGQRAQLQIIERKTELEDLVRA